MHASTNPITVGHTAVTSTAQATTKLATTVPAKNPYAGYTFQQCQALHGANQAITYKMQWQCGYNLPPNSQLASFGHTLGSSGGAAGLIVALIIIAVLAWVFRSRPGKTATT